jgi:hypothetical protein
VWIDDTSGYGTFPLESMKSGVPVMGIVPNLFPHWMNEENGIWVNDEIKLPDFVADFIQNWLEDNINETLYKNMDNTVEKLPTKETFELKVLDLFKGYLEVREKSFTDQLNNLKEN